MTNYKSFTFYSYHVNFNEHVYSPCGQKYTQKINNTEQAVQKCKKYIKEKTINQSVTSRAAYGIMLNNLTLFTY